MPEIEAQFWVALILQIPIVVGVGYLLARGVFVTGRELTRREEDHQAELQRRTESLTREIEYRETLRQEEQRGRVQAEERLSVMSRGIEQITALMNDIEKEIIRGRR